MHRRFSRCLDAIQKTIILAMKKNPFILALIALGLISCAKEQPINASSEIVPSSIESSIGISNEISSFSEAVSSSEDLIPSSSLSSESSSSKSSSSSNVVSSSSSIWTDEETLPCGNVKLSAPENKNSPIDITSWATFDMESSLPDYWSHIYGNKITNASFYASANGGGVKMDQLHKGLQSPFINSWEKIEVRLSISSVNNNSKKPDKGKPIMWVYGYNQNSQLIEQGEISEGSINANTKTVQFYIRNSNVAYFEIRLNAFPYKGNQCYNFGIGGVSLKGWPYAS